MIPGYNPGDVFITDLTMSSPRGSLDLGSMFATMKVFESIFVPNAIAEITVFDVNDVLGNMNIIGDETVTTTFGAPGGTMASYTFALDQITNIHGEGSTKSKIYTLHGVGEETMYAKTNFVQKNYQTDIASIVSDIHKNFLMSGKSLSTESTSGTQNIMIPNYDPFKAIDMVRRRAVSASNPSSTFLYFENALGMYFKTMEGMLKQGPIKTFLHQDTVGHSIYTDTSTNIIALDVPQIASSTERISMGGLKQRVSTYNIRTRKYQYKDVAPPSSGFNSDAFTSKYGNKYGSASMIPVDTASRPFTGIDTMTPNQLGYISNLMQTQVKIKVNGDALVKAGDVIQLNIPEMINITSPQPLDPQIAGNYLVTRMCRNIGPSQQSPRYTDSIECIKGDTTGAT